jgi:competence protein ComEA
MTPDKQNRLWLLATGILIVIILVGSLVIWLGRDKGQEIIYSSSSQATASPQNILIDGAVANPGSYPLRDDDTLKNVLDAAGGVNQNADLSAIKIIVPQTGEAAVSQKVDINTAEVWLLQALPGIGEVRAQAIVDYRSQNGPFNNIDEILQVPGLNQSTYEKIKDLITIAE